MAGEEVSNSNSSLSSSGSLEDYLSDASDVALSPIRMSPSPSSPVRTTPISMSISEASPRVSLVNTSPRISPVRMSPILVISDDETSILDSSPIFNYNNNLEEIPVTSYSPLRSISSPNFFAGENNDNTEERIAWEDNNEDMIAESSARRINPESPIDRSTNETDVTEEQYLHHLNILRPSTSSQLFDNQRGESVDGDEHLFAPEESPELDENMAPSTSSTSEEITSRQRLSSSRDTWHCLLSPSGVLPLTSRYPSLRTANRFAPRSVIRNRFSASLPFRLNSEIQSSGSNDCPLNLAISRRIPSYWLNRSRLLNRTRSTYEHLLLRNRLQSSSESGNINSESVNTTESNEDLPFRIRRRLRYLPDEEEIDSPNPNMAQNLSHTRRFPFGLQSRPNSIEQRTSTFLRSIMDLHHIYSPRNSSSTTPPVNCVRARSVSPTAANPWFPSSVDHDSLDDTSVDVRNHSDRPSRNPNTRSVMGFINDNQEAQIERPNTPLPPPISDDETPPTPTPSSTNYDSTTTAGVTSTVNARPENTTSTVRTINLKEIPQTYEELNYELIQLLECPICFEYSTPPINQCLQGHIICSNCRQRVNSCPTCRNMFQESRNLVMEKVAALLRYPCKNAITGCLETLFLLQKEQHEQSCGFRHYVCFIPSCNWRGYKPELLVHVQEAHENHVIHGSSVNLLIPITGQTKKVWLMSAFNELFYIIFFATLGILKGCVRFIGDSSKSNNYTYTISVTSDEEMLRNMNYTRTTHAYEENTENIDILDSYDLFTISYPSLSTFRRGTRAPVRVTVEEVNSRSQ